MRIAPFVSSEVDTRSRQAASLDFAWDERAIQDDIALEHKPNRPIPRP